MSKTVNLIAITANIVSAWAARNPTNPAQVAALTATVHSTLRSCVEGNVAPTMSPAPELVPAVSVKRSVTPDYVVCLEDGLKFKSMKRHLRITYGLTPDDYRAKWGLSADHPIVAPNYAKARSELAKQIGLGKNGRGGQPVAVIEPAEVEVFGASVQAGLAGNPSPDVEAALVSQGVTLKPKRERKAKVVPATQAEAAPEAPAKVKRGGAMEPAVAVTADELTRVIAEARTNPLATFSDKIICLVDGKMVSDLGRHIARKGMKPDAYRAQFGLPTDYPMTVPAATKWIAKNKAADVAQAA